MKGKGEPGRTMVAQLQLLLEAERVAAATVSGLIPMAATPATGRLLEKLRDDEAWSCAGLTRVIRHLGGKVPHDDGSVAPRVRGGSSVRERLGGLTRDQARVVKRLDRILGAELDRESGGFLRQMRSLHAENVHRCEELIATLPAGAAAGRARRMRPVSSENSTSRVWPGAIVTSSSSCQRRGAAPAALSAGPSARVTPSR
jgi:hypothetical protein